MVGGRVAQRRIVQDAHQVVRDPRPAVIRLRKAPHRGLPHQIGEPDVVLLVDIAALLDESLGAAQRDGQPVEVQAQKEVRPHPLRRLRPRVEADIVVIVPCQGHGETPALQIVADAPGHVQREIPFGDARFDPRGADVGGANPMARIKHDVQSRAGRNLPGLELFKGQSPAPANSRPSMRGVACGRFAVKVG